MTAVALDWQAYDAFDWAHSRQRPMPEGERVAVEGLAADLLGLPGEVRGRPWGQASPPGRFAATVIHVSSATSHRFREAGAARSVADFAVKVFKTTPDALREAARVLPFHRSLVYRLPGLPREHVQKTVDAGSFRGRPYVIQEWVPGATLEDHGRRPGPGAPIDPGRARTILRQLFGEIVIPLWGEGVVWWDVRDANYVWNDQTGRLSLIDCDCLAGYVKEILQTPAEWAGREQGQATALPRLRQMTIRIVWRQSIRRKAEAEAAVRRGWSGLEAALRRLGRDPARKEMLLADARAALQRLLTEVTPGAS